MGLKIHLCNDKCFTLIPCYLEAFKNKVGFQIFNFFRRIEHVGFFNLNT